MRWLASLCAAGLCLAVPVARAADPQPYTITLAPSGVAGLDAAAHDSSTLVSLRERAPVGGFALVARARSDVGRFTAALQSFGYYMGTVAITVAGRPLDDPGLPGALDAASANPPVSVVASLTLGPQFHIGHVTLSGDVPAGSAAQLGLAPGAPARAAEVMAAHDRLLAALQSEGRALARVDPPVATLDVAMHALDIAFAVQAGPVVDLGPITFAGTTEVNQDYLRRRFMLAPGQRYDPAAVERARQDLAAVPALASVRLETPPALVRGVLPVTVVVADRPRHAVDLAAAFSTDQGGSATVSWTHRNLFGNAENLKLNLAAIGLGGSASRQPGYDADALLAFPDWFHRDQTLTLDTQAVRESLDAYDRTAALGSAKLSRKLDPQLTLGGGVAFEVAKFKQEDVSRTYKLAQLPLTAAYDTSNSLFDPTQGIRATVIVTPSVSFGSGTGHTSEFAIVQASAAIYLDVGHWLLGEAAGRGVLALHGLVGDISGARAFDIPPDQRFYAGGGGTVRGWRYQSIGPVFPDRRPAGGTRVEVGSVEWRQRFGESYGAVVFVDGGQVGGNSPLPGADALRIGAGAGFRYYTAFGPIRVDIAAPLNKDKTVKTDLVEAYIGIGQAF